jgi:hypothetical protein
VGEELQGVEAVHPIYLAGARTAGRVGPHDDPGWRREGSRWRGGCGAQGRRWRGWRDSRDQGVAARGAGVAREGAGRAVHGEQSVRRWSGGVLSGEEAEEAKCGRASG